MEDLREVIEKLLDYIMQKNPEKYYKDYYQNIYIDKTTDEIEYNFDDLKITIETALYKDNSKVFIAANKEHEEEVGP